MSITAFYLLDQVDYELDLFVILSGVVSQTIFYPAFALYYRADGSELFLLLLLLAI